MSQDVAAIHSSPELESIGIGPSILAWDGQLECPYHERDEFPYGKERHRPSPSIVGAATLVVLFGVGSPSMYLVDQYSQARTSRLDLPSEFVLDASDQALSLSLSARQEDEGTWDYEDLDCGAIEPPSGDELVFSFSLKVHDLPRLQPDLGSDVLELPEDVDA